MWTLVWPGSWNVMRRSCSTVVGIGPDTAVALLITVGDNPERLRQ